MSLELLQFLPIAVFSFGAPAFVMLSFFYWSHRGHGTSIFRVFTALSAAAFLLNLALLVSSAESPLWETVRSLVAGLLPPLMLHLTVERAGSRLPRRGLWLFALRLLYIVSAAAALLPRIFPAEDWDTAPFLLLLFCAALAVGVLLSAPEAQAGRHWMLFLFGAMFLCALAALWNPHPLLLLAPDYLLLLFFAVHLYYSERLAFFDVFLRLGSFAVIGVIALAAAFLAIPLFRAAFHADWSLVWLAGLTLLPIWLLAPFLYRRLGAWVDRKALGRRYSAPEAQIAFVLGLQDAATEDQLHRQAVRLLEEIFDCRAQLEWGRRIPASLLDLSAPIHPQGGILLHSRANQSPFLSDDRHLLESLAGILGVNLQNVRLRTLANRAELRALRAQINPHFLFNALNAVASFIASKPDAAEDTLTQLADVFRYTLNRSSSEFIPLREELAFLRSYLAVEQARFGSRLAIEINVDPRAHELSIPAMLIQPLVENAIKHGTSRIVGPGRIELRIGFDGASHVHISVHDNGPGFPAGFAIGEPEPHGLHNVAERLRGYYGDRAFLHWGHDSAGTCVGFQIPVAEVVR